MIPPSVEGIPLSTHTFTWHEEQDKDIVINTLQGTVRAGFKPMVIHMLVACCTDVLPMPTLLSDNVRTETKPQRNLVLIK